MSIKEIPREREIIFSKKIQMCADIEIGTENSEEIDWVWLSILDNSWAMAL